MAVAVQIYISLVLILIWIAVPFCASNGYAELYDLDKKNRFEDLKSACWLQSGELNKEHDKMLYEVPNPISISEQNRAYPANSSPIRVELMKISFCL